MCVCVCPSSLHQCHGYWMFFTCRPQSTTENSVSYQLNTFHMDQMLMVSFYKSFVETSQWKKEILVNPDNAPQQEWAVSPIQVFKIWLCVFYCSDEKCLDILDFYLTTELSERLVFLRSINWTDPPRPPMATWVYLSSSQIELDNRMNQQSLLVCWLKMSERVALMKKESIWAVKPC